jgi:hypothetical protein
MRKLWLLILAVTVGAWWVMSRPTGTGAPPVDWRGELAQAETDRPPFQVETGKGKVTLHPRASFDAPGKVVSAERYRLDGGAFLSPVDVVLTWGKLPEEPYRSEVDYGQMTRYYFWRTGSPGIDLGYVQAHSSNMHLIPATPNVRRALLGIGSGDAVRLKGLLVDASGENGFTWGTSMSREDSGPGACELVWVEAVQVERTLYR